MLAGNASKIQYHSVAEIGRAFLEHYEMEGFKPIPGSSLLDPSVPMSFVMSAGLVQVETSARQYEGQIGDRYVLLQNCFRHFDLGRIGKSDLHLSFFQMAGAFHFGPVSKEAAVARAWRLLTEVFTLPVERLWVTCFAGDDVAGTRFEADGEAHTAWLRLGLPMGRIVGLGRPDNFWKQGASVVGKAHVHKCGPNTEVFFDRGQDLACGPACLPGCPCGRFVELLNMLFITWHIEDEHGVVRPIETPFTETVMGVERMAMLLQGAPSVFDVDSLRPLLEQVRRFARPSASGVAERIHQERVLVDHLRALLFLTADGAPSPGRGGRAYLMRQLTRGMLSAQKLLGIRDSGFYETLLRKALDLYVADQPQLSSAQGTLRTYIAEEVACFEPTLARGQRYLDRLLRQRREDWISGDEMVRLEKQHGIPTLLLEAMLRERRVRYSRDAYQAAYRRWRAAVGAS